MCALDRSTVGRAEQLKSPASSTGPKYPVMISWTPSRKASRSETAVGAYTLTSKISSPKMVVVAAIQCAVHWFCRYGTSLVVAMLGSRRVATPSLRLVLALQRSPVRKPFSWVPPASCMHVRELRDVDVFRMRLWQKCERAATAISSRLRKCANQARTLTSCLRKPRTFWVASPNVTSVRCTAALPTVRRVAFSASRLRVAARRRSSRNSSSTLAICSSPGRCVKKCPSESCVRFSVESSRPCSAFRFRPRGAVPSLAVMPSVGRPCLRERD